LQQELAVDKPLTGRTIAIPETRELNVLAEMIEEKGATAVRCPLVGIHDAPDPEPIVAWLRELVAAEFDDLILLTGEGLRRLLGFARRAEMFDDVVAAVGRVRKITRGPKPARALREIGLAPDLAADQPTTDGVIATLSREELRGRAVGLQLYAQVPNPKLFEFLERAGATVQTVAPYIYAPASDADRVVDLIGRLERGEVDCIAFTSASQVERLWEVAQTRGMQDALAAGIARTQIAAVGPVVAEELRHHGAVIHVMPESSFFMRPMVNGIVAAFTESNS
jgi:uroporphyrinogen-III synthase